MSKKLVQINFNYDLAREVLNERAKEFVRTVQQVPSLVWKTWIVNDQEQLTGGIYLFENEEAAKAYVEGPIIDQIRNSPVFRKEVDKTLKFHDRPMVISLFHGFQGKLELRVIGDGDLCKQE